MRYVDIFPPRELLRIKKLELDVIHIFTPSQIGLIGVRASHKYEIPCVIQHCTDMYEFAEHYPAVLPGILALAGIIFPMSVKLKPRDIGKIAKLYRPRGVTKWNKDIIKTVITMLYSKAGCYRLVRKSRDQLLSWQGQDYRYGITLMPNGVNALPRPSDSKLAEFVRDGVLGLVMRFLVLLDAWAKRKTWIS